MRTVSGARPRRFQWVHASVIAVCAAACLASCDSSSSSSAPNASDTSNLEQALATSFCTYHARCCGGGAGGAGSPDGGGGAGGAGPVIACDSSGLGGAAATCSERALLGVQQQLALVATAFDEGLLTINDTVATACAAAYGSRACSASAPATFPDVEAALADPACSGLFTGYVPLAERCDMTAECVSGTYCLSQSTGEPISSLEGGGTLGVCFDYAGAGAACNTDADCASTLTCSTATFTCAAP
jgi:hypothetical protein